MERRRRIALGLAVAALVAASAHRPRLGLSIATTAMREQALPQAKAAFRFAVLGGSVLVTWGAERLR